MRNFRHPIPDFCGSAKGPDLALSRSSAAARGPPRCASTHGIDCAAVAAVSRDEGSMLVRASIGSFSRVRRGTTVLVALALAGLALAARSDAFVYWGNHDGD